jgi:gas vesicle protein
MHGRDMHSNRLNTWIGFFAGISVGAGVALLLAPQKGTDLRAKLTRFTSKTGDEIVDRGKEAWDSVSEAGTQYMKTGSKVLKEAARRAEEATERAPEFKRGEPR